MVIHGSFIINLCQDPTDYRHYKGINILVEDLDVSVKLDAIGVIIHMGNDTEKNGNAVSKINYIKGIKEALRRSNKKRNINIYNNILIYEYLYVLYLSCMFQWLYFIAFHVLQIFNI